MSDFNMPPGVPARDIPGNDNDAWREEGDMQAHAVMTLRDVFAVAAISALISQRAYPWDKLAPQYAYSVADAMLRERMRS